MSSRGSLAGNGDGSNDSWATQSREPGARRKKFAVYLRTANELRLSYQNSYGPSWISGKDSGWTEEQDGNYGPLPDGALVRTEEEEIMIFPSYAKKHAKRKVQSTASQLPQVDDGLDYGSVHNGSSGNSDFWRQEWNKLEDENAIIDADVHGCIFTPFQGQMNRKQRIFMSLARQLVGLSAPSAPSTRDRIVSSSDSGSRAASPHAMYGKADNRAEELSASKEADAIIRRGEAEQEKANRGSYSELSRSKGHQAAASPLQKVTSADTIASGHSTNKESTQDVYGISAQKNETVSQRAFWSQPSSMSEEEMVTANSLLMSRLQLFMATPSVNSPVSAFFYNQEHSRQKTVYTDAAGHFALRAALDFVPTHVRVLAGEDLSATEEVTVIEPHGVSLISDIDDTIKHSAIGSGAREIFRNAFTRELADLTIDGVKELYKSLSGMGVHLHYVSNSPWQMFPVLKQFFALADLPPGSFHLKQYSGMLQGIFEPVAERKKGTLDRLADDFPERQFVLVGDSGEADLEVYTEFALENPGRVLAIFIRDITTSTAKAFFDSAIAPFTSNISAASNASDKVKEDEPGLAQPSPLKGNALQRRNISGLAARTSDTEETAMRKAIKASLRDVHGGEKGDSMMIEAGRDTEEKPRGRWSAQNDNTLGDLAKGTMSTGGATRGRTGQLASAPSPVRPNSIVTPPIKPSAARIAEIAANEAKSGRASSAISQRVPPPPVAKPIALRSKPTDGGASVQHLSKGSSRIPPSPPQPRRQSNSSSRVALINATSSNAQDGSSSSRSSSSNNIPVQRLHEILSLQSRPQQMRSKTTNDASERTLQAESQTTSYGSSSPRRQSVTRNLEGLKDGNADETDAPEKKSSSRATPPALPPRRGFSSYPYAAAQMVATKVYGAWAGAEVDGAVESAGQPGGGDGNSDNHDNTVTNGASATRQQQQLRKRTSASSIPTPPPGPTSSPSPASSGPERSPPPPPNKKEEMWRRRWMRAQETLKAEGVVLRSWRVGTEVMEEAKRLVDLAQRGVGNTDRGRAEWAGPKETKVKGKQMEPN